MNTKDLKNILTIYEEKSISKAAERLHVAQPALSRFLRNLERELDVRIFDRASSPLVPTDYGWEYIRTAQQILELQSDMEHRFEEIKNAKIGHLRVGMPIVRASVYIPTVIPEFSRQFPDIDISLVEDSVAALEQDMLQGKLDLVIASGIPEDSRIAYKIIDMERIYLATPVGMTSFADREATFEDVIFRIPPEKMRFILLHKWQHMRRIADRVFEEYGLSPHILLTTRVTDTALKLCAAGLGLALVSEVTMDDPYYKSMKADYFPLDRRFSLPVVASYRKYGYLPQSARYFLDVVEAIYGKPFTV